MERNTIAATGASKNKKKRTSCVSVMKRYCTGSKKSRGALSYDRVFPMPDEDGHRAKSDIAFKFMTLMKS